MSIVYNFTGNGVSWSDESSNGFATRGTAAYNNLIRRRDLGEIVIGIDKPFFRKKAKSLWEEKISHFFTDKELIHMSIFLASGNQKAQAVYAWLIAGFSQAMSYYDAIRDGTIPEMDYNNLGNPPFTYEQVTSE